MPSLLQVYSLLNYHFLSVCKVSQTLWFFNCISLGNFFPCIFYKSAARSMDSNLILLSALIIWKVREAELSINFISTFPKKHPVVEDHHWWPWLFHWCAQALCSGSQCFPKENLSQALGVLSFYRKEANRLGFFPFLTGFQILACFPCSSKVGFV